MRPTCPTHYIVLDITCINYKAPHCIIFSSSLLLNSTEIQIPSSEPLSQTPYNSRYYCNMKVDLCLCFTLGKRDPVLLLYTYISSLFIIPGKFRDFIVGHILQIFNPLSSIYMQIKYLSFASNILVYLLIQRSITYCWSLQL
jgi:hypothetical protein